MSSLIVGSKIVTAEVFALTTNVDTHAAARTPPAAARPLSSAWAGPSSRRHGVVGTGGTGVWSPKKR